MCFLAHSVHLGVLARLPRPQSAFDFEDQTSSFYIERAPAKTKAKDKQAGYCGRLAKALAEGLWEEEEEEAPKSKMKRARSS